MTESSILHKNGVVYTPKELSNYLAKKIYHYAIKDSKIILENKLSVIDPANGDGMLLEAMLKNLHSFTEKKITLCGIDIDYFANESSKHRIKSLTAKDKLILINTNSLTPYYSKSLFSGWSKIFNKVEVKDGFDILIANPPWGADISEYRDYLDESYYELLRGQVDSYELFIELALKITKKGGYFGFLVPDSILNHGKKNIRERILSNTQIKFIARLGEKLFYGINRACVIIVCKNNPPIQNNMVDCFRLNKNDREKILSRKMSFESAEIRHIHRVPQTRFRNNDGLIFNIDLKENEVKVIDKILKKSTKFKDELSITRGIELGSSGNITKCPICNIWSPVSNKNTVKCNNCNNINKKSNLEEETIVLNKKSNNSVQLITGKNIKRYQLMPNLWIKKDYLGINYKPNKTYEPPKILIRKTGVGITASIDYTESYTTQVVYILRSKQDSSINLEYILALLNSRAYFFYLMKTFGELEWRSHPYLTQSQILSFPLPDISSNNGKLIEKKIIKIVKNAMKRDKPNSQEDLEIELLIGKLFHFEKEDFEIIFNAINDSDNLLPIKALKDVKLNDIIKKMNGN